VQVALWYAQAGNGQAARGTLEQAIAEDPKHPEGYILNANIAFADGRPTEAILNLKAALDLSADTRWDADQKKRFAREARNGLLETYSARGDQAAAKEYAIELLNADPKNGVLRSRLAGITFRLDKPAEAEKELTQAFADDPTIDPPELQLSFLWQQRANGEPDAAKLLAHLEKVEEWLKKAVSGHPKNAKPAREYGWWLLDHGKPDAAGPYVEAAGKLDPTAKETAVLKAVWLLHKKDPAAAEPILEGVCKDAPGDLLAHSYLCLCLAESGDEKKKKRAVDLADTLVKQNPKAAVGHAVYGWCLYKVGRTDDAERALAAVLSAGQVSFDSAYFVARVLTDRMKFEEAHKLLTGAVTAPHGTFLYRPDAKVLLTEVTKKLPEKKDEPKKDDKKP
jgi:Tfp pilus assembly protein PilF